ncbi:MAG: tetratricopeptide repeat protein [Planctomycetota bacterium]|jgi:tetratricopeptide (TPR) repeat protein
MKAKHRHELKTNVLAEWIANFPQWARKNLRTIIFVSVLAVLVMGSASYHWYKKNIESARRELLFTNLINELIQGKPQILQAQARGMDISYLLIQTADSLQSFAESTKDGDVAALALIKRGEALRTELHYRFGSVSERDTATAMERAKASYTEALEKGSSDPSLTAMAKLGLGLCEEEVGNFEQAEQIYNDIIADAALEGTVGAAQARQRLETLADYEEQVVFKAAPKPEPNETDILESQIQLTGPGVNLGLEVPNEVMGGEFGLPEAANEGWEPVWEAPNITEEVPNIPAIE